MTARPIIFTGESVRAILDGRKTMTRRVVKPPKWSTASAALVDFECPYCRQIRDQLWVKETWQPYHDEGRLNTCVKYKADGGMMKPTLWNDNQGYWCESASEDKKWRSPIYMPRWASRIELEIVGVKAERIQDISVDDCRKEGEPKGNNDIGVRYGFGQLWNQINEKCGYGWDRNPWVWVIEFMRIK